MGQLISKTMIIRTATDRDVLILGDVFEDAVRSVGPQHYSPEQVEAWAAAAHDRETFGQRMLQYKTFVAEDETGPVGFATLGTDGHIGAVYVRGDCQGRGMGRALLEALLAAAHERGLNRLYAEASVFSLPLFEHRGFAVIGTEVVERREVKFERYLVECISTQDV